MQESSLHDCHWLSNRVTQYSYDMTIPTFEAFSLDNIVFLLLRFPSKCQGLLHMQDSCLFSSQPRRLPTLSARRNQIHCHENPARTSHSPSSSRLDLRTASFRPVDPKSFCNVQLLVPRQKCCKRSAQLRLPYRSLCVMQHSHRNCAE